MEAMDLMDPRRRREHDIRLVIGYVLVGIALLLLTLILLFVAYGFGLQNGRVIQSGLFFLSSTPSPAQIYVNGERYHNDTNTKVLLPEGTYNVVVKRDGYRDWQRSITVSGGQVEDYTYPFLFPQVLTTTTMHTYVSAPSLVTETSDQHWLLALRPASLSVFDVYDLTNPSKAATVLSVPTALLQASSAKQSLSVVAWASDNNHLLLRHKYGSSEEYILFNRSNPAQSQNLTKALKLSTTNVDLSFDDAQSDHFIVLARSSHVLSSANLGTPALRPLLSPVLTFAADSSGSIAYTTPDKTDAHKVLTMYYDGSSKYVVRHDSASDSLTLAVDSYSGDVMLAVADAQKNAAYVYRDPVGDITDPHLGVAVPEQSFTIKHPSFAAFSTGGKYVVFENGQKFATYDADNQSAVVYSVASPLDAPQLHARWMDGARLYFVSHGQVVVFDYDGQNRQSLVSADAQYPLAFDDNYKSLFALVPSADNKSQELLTRTLLRTPADQ